MADDRIARKGPAPEVPATLKEFMSADEYAEIAEESKTGLATSLPRISIMLGGVCLFQTPDGETTKAFDGVLVYRHPARAYWEKEVTEGSSEPPTCASQDGVIGSVKRDNKGRFGTCEDCALARWGSNPKGGKGQACRSMDRLHLYLPGQDTPFVLTVPPTSLKILANYSVQLMTGNPKVLPIQVLTRFTLERKEKGVNKWSVLKLTKIRELKKDEQEAALALRRSFLPIMQAQVIAASDYVPDGAAPAAA